MKILGGMRGIWVERKVFRTWVLSFGFCNLVL